MYGTDERYNAKSNSQKHHYATSKIEHNRAQSIMLPYGLINGKLQPITSWSPKGVYAILKKGCKASFLPSCKIKDIILFGQSLVNYIGPVVNWLPSACRTPIAQLSIVRPMNWLKKIRAKTRDFLRGYTNTQPSRTNKVMSKYKRFMAQRPESEDRHAQVLIQSAINRITQTISSEMAKLTADLLALNLDKETVDKTLSNIQESKSKIEDLEHQDTIGQAKDEGLSPEEKEIFEIFDSQPDYEYAIDATPFRLRQYIIVNGMRPELEKRFAKRPTEFKPSYKKWAEQADARRESKTRLEKIRENNLIMQASALHRKEAIVQRYETLHEEQKQLYAAKQADKEKFLQLKKLKQAKPQIKYQFSAPYYDC